MFSPTDPHICARAIATLLAEVPDVPDPCAFAATSIPAVPAEAERPDSWHHPRSAAMMRAAAAAATPAIVDRFKAQLQTTIDAAAIPVSSITYWARLEAGYPATFAAGRAPPALTLLAHPTLSRAELGPPRDPAGFAVELELGNDISSSARAGERFPCGAFDDYRVAALTLDGTLRYTAIMHTLAGRSYAMLLADVPSRACLMRHLLMRMAAHVAARLAPGGAAAPTPAAPSSSSCFMDTFAGLSRCFHGTLHGGLCASSCLDQLFSGLYGADAVLDWSRPLDLLRAALSRSDHYGSYEIQALAASLVFATDLPTGYGALVHLARELGEHLPAAAHTPLEGPARWVEGYAVQEVLLTCLVRLAAFGELGLLHCIHNAHAGALTTHCCVAETRRANIDAGYDEDAAPRSAKRARIHH